MTKSVSEYTMAHNLAALLLDLLSIRMVDQATTASRDTRSAGLTTGRDRRINRDGEILLDEFFEKCQAPNDAEVQMLATVCGVETWDIQRWCKSCRSRAYCEAVAAKFRSWCEARSEPQALSLPDRAEQRGDRRHGLASPEAA